MTKMCDVTRHEDESLEFICINPQCKGRRIFCKKCSESHPTECMSSIIKIQDILDRDLRATAKFIPGESINEAVELMEKSHLSTNKQIYQTFEAFISGEFDKLVADFEQNVKETKEKILNRYNEIYEKSNFNIESFRLKLQHLLEFENFIEILDPLFHDQCDITTTDEKLISFIDNIHHSQKVDIQNLSEMADQFIFFARDIQKADLNPFLEARERISLKMFEDFPSLVQTWSWNSSKKSSSLVLSENNLQVLKSADTIFSYSVVFGSLVFSQGRHEWEIEINTNYRGHSWGSFGIIETDFIGNFENFPYREAISLSTDGVYQRMEKSRVLPEYDNIRYICTLNMKTGEFEISVGGKLIAKQTKLGGKVFLPFVCLCYPGNMARIRIIRSTN